MTCTDYKRVLERVYIPDAYARRLERLATLLDRSGCRRGLSEGDLRGRISVLELMHRIVTTLPETRTPFWRVFAACANNNLSALRIIVVLMTLYLHLRPFSRLVVAAIDRCISVLDDEASRVDDQAITAPAA